MNAMHHLIGDIVDAPQVLNHLAGSRVPVFCQLSEARYGVYGHDISRQFGGELSAAAEAVETEMLIIVASADRIVTPGPALSFAEMIGARTLVLESNCGHAAIWCEAERHNAAVREFLGPSQ